MEEQIKKLCELGLKAYELGVKLGLTGSNSFCSVSTPLNQLNIYIAENDVKTWSIEFNYKVEVLDYLDSIRIKRNVTISELQKVYDDGESLVDELSSFRFGKIKEEKKVSREKLIEELKNKLKSLEDIDNG